MKSRLLYLLCASYYGASPILSYSVSINDGYIIQWKKRLFILDKPSLTLRRRKVEVKPKREEEVKLAVPKPRKKSKYRPSPDHPWNKRYKDMPNRW